MRKLATRVISTRVAIDGESEYKASLSRINSELKTLQSALKLTESEYKDNASSMDALSAKGKALSDLYRAQAGKVEELSRAHENAQRSAEEYAKKRDELSRRLDENNKALDALKTTVGDTAEEEARLKAENASLNEEIGKNEARFNAAEKGVNSWGTQLNNAKAELNNLEGEIGDNKRAMSEAAEATDKAADTTKEYAEETGNAVQSVSDLEKALAAAGLIKGLQAIADAISACVKASVEFESAMAGVAKTTDLTDVELSGMGDQLKKLSTQMPITATELANITEAAGQLGIEKDSLVDFTKVMANLGVATNLSSTEAATALAKFANITRMSADDYEKLGSTIVALGNNFATTEADIVSMATRLSSAGAVVGLSEAEIMAVSTALSSVGIEAEAGGSAISKLLKQIETSVKMYGKASAAIDATGKSLRELEMLSSHDAKAFKALAESMGLTTKELSGFVANAKSLEQFSDVSGKTADEFIQAWGTNAVGALGSFIDGLGGIDAAGGSAVEVLDSMGLTEVRLSNAILALSSSQGILTDALGMANTAWDENSALANEAAVRYETTESKMLMLKNASENLRISIGDQLTPTIKNFAETGTSALNWMSGLVERHEVLVPLLTSLVTTVGVFALGVGGLAAATKIAAAAQWAWNTAMSANPIGIAITAVATLALGITALAVLLKNDAVPSVNELTEASKDAKKAFEDSNKVYDSTETSVEATSRVAEKYIRRMRELETQIWQTEESQEEYRKTVDKLNDLLPELNLKINEQTGFVDGGADAVMRQVEAWEQLALAEAATARYSEQLRAYNDATLAVEENVIKLRDAEEERIMTLERRAVIEQKIIDLQKTIDESQRAGIDLSEEEYEQNRKALEQIALLSEEYQDLSGALEVNALYQTNLNTAIDEGRGVVQEYAGEYDVAKRVMDEMLAPVESVTEKTQALAESQEDAALKASLAQEAYGNAVGALEKMGEAYEQTYEKALQSINGQIGLFSEYKASVSADTDSTAKMVDILQGQIDTLAEYTENLNKAAKYGFDEGLLQSLMDGTPESMGYLQTLVGEVESLGGTIEDLPAAASTFVEEFNNKFKEVETAKNTFAETVTAMQTDFTRIVTEMLSDAEILGNEGGAAIVSAVATAINENGGEISEAGAKVIAEALRDKNLIADADTEKVGEYLTSGIAKGVINEENTLYENVRLVIEGAIDAANKAAEIRSPSRKMEETGENMTRGIIEGIKKPQRELEMLLDEISRYITDLMERTAKDTVERFSHALSPISGKTESELRMLRNAIQSGTATLPSDMQSVGDQMINGMITGINNRAGGLYSTIRSVVNNAVSAANAAAVVASPSKKTTKIGEQMGDGFIVGLENRMNKTKQAMTRLMDGMIPSNAEMDKTDIAYKINASIPDLPTGTTTAVPKQQPASYKIENKIQIDKMVVRDDQDIRGIASELHRMTTRDMRYRGVVPA